MTPEFVLKLGWAAGRVLASKGRNTVLIGKDTRISGYMFEAVLEAGLIAAGVNVRLLGPMPTPGIAYLTRTFRADAGIVISASHNPYYDNGLKFFSDKGVKLADEVELAIEAEINQPMVTMPSDSLGKAERVNDAPGRYIEFCKSTVATGTSLRGLTLVVDCAHGATYHIAPSVFKELGAKVIRVGTDPDGLNINQECGSTAPQRLVDTVLAHSADLGIAIDGDGDRLIMVDDSGEVVDGDELLFIIAQARHQEGKLNGGVVGTLMSNLGMEHALQSLSIPFARAAVGDRYVMETMQERGWQLGGESSGHIICLDKTTTGDAIVSALQVLQRLVTAGKSLRQLKMGMHKYPQKLVNVPVQVMPDLKNSLPVQRAVCEAENQLAGKGRILLRSSGTEPLVRVMVEGEDDTLVKRIAQDIAFIVGQATNPQAESNSV